MLHTTVQGTLVFTCSMYFYCVPFLGITGQKPWVKISAEVAEIIPLDEITKDRTVVSLDDDGDSELHGSDENGVTRARTRSSDRRRTFISPTTDDGISVKQEPVDS